MSSERREAPGAANGHHCQAVGCQAPCTPAHLMCLKHWQMVPRDVQNAVWGHFRPGQGADQPPSLSWCRAADKAVAAVAKRERKSAPTLTFSATFYPTEDELAARSQSVESRRSSRTPAQGDLFGGRR